jgi:hypothetical protein
MRKEVKESLAMLAIGAVVVVLIVLPAFMFLK